MRTSSQALSVARILPARSCLEVALIHYPDQRACMCPFTGGYARPAMTLEVPTVHRKLLGDLTGAPQDQSTCPRPCSVGACRLGNRQRVEIGQKEALCWNAIEHSLHFKLVPLFPVSGSRSKASDSCALTLTRKARFCLPFPYVHSN